MTNSTSLWGSEETKFFYELSPEVVMRAMETLGLAPNGRLMTMNSLENRVYDLEITNSEDFNLQNTFVVTKFYRPGRWSLDQIKEEHQFLFDLKEAEIPVIAPIIFNNESVFKDESTGLFFTVFEKMGGRAPDELSLENAERLGSLVARMHLVGEKRKSLQRLKFSAENFIKNNSAFVLSENIIPSHLETAYRTTCDELYLIAHEKLQNQKMFRIHGDLHLGNIISRNDVFTLIDFDDCVYGPAIQDLWLIAPRRDEEGMQIRNALLDGYYQFRDLSATDFKLLEVLRSMRLVHYYAWLVKRRKDPTFIHHFGDIESAHFFEKHINDLKEQLFLISENKTTNESDDFNY